MRAQARNPLVLAAILLIVGGNLATAQVSELAVERRLAAELGLTVGDTLRIGPAVDSLTKLGVVAAIYEPRPDPAEIAKRERHVRMHLPDRQRCSVHRTGWTGMALGSGPGCCPTLPRLSSIVLRLGTGFTAPRRSPRSPLSPFWW